jgi:Holliday junction resolvase RusA-like endonuclease
MNPLFAIPNENAKTENARLAKIPRDILKKNLEDTLLRVKGLKKTLPLQFVVQCRPLSTNQMSGRRKTYETKNYIAYRDLIAKKAGGFYGVSKDDKFRVYVEVGFSNKRADADNVLKPLLDSITACIDDIFDDSQVYIIEVKKTIVKKGYEFVRFHMEVLREVFKGIEEYPNYAISNSSHVVNITTGKLLHIYEINDKEYVNINNVSVEVGVLFDKYFS